jgi:hypothetical protein
MQVDLTRVSSHLLVEEFRKREGLTFINIITTGRVGRNTNLIHLERRGAASLIDTTDALIVNQLEFSTRKDD